MTGREYIEHLLVAADDPHPEVRETAIYFLITIGHPLSLEKVADLVLHGTQASYRTVGIKYLLRRASENPEFVVSVLAQVARDRQWEVARDAIGALGLVDHPDATRALVGLLAGENNEYIVLNAIDALSTQAQNTSSREIRDSATMGIANMLYNGRSSTIRKAAAQGLGKIGTSDAALLLLAALEKEKSKSVREEILFALGEVRIDELDEESVGRIMEILEKTAFGPNPKEQDAVISGLAKYLGNEGRAGNCLTQSN